MLNKALFVGAALGCVLGMLAFFVRGGDLHMVYAMLCALAGWLAIVDERQRVDRERIDALEDAHSRRWEP